jgi:hypothetical protein
MKKIAPIFVVVAAVTLLCETAISYAQDRDRTHVAVPQVEGTRRGEGPHQGDGDRDHHHRPTMFVGVPIFVGPGYSSYYLAAPMDAYRTLEGFYYYCVELGDYYPALQDCPSGWSLVP